MSDDEEVQKLLREAIAEMPATIESIRAFEPKG
jgi:hypothetical protein